MKKIKTIYLFINNYLKNKYVSNGLYLVGFFAFYIFYLNPKVDFKEPTEKGIQFEQISLNEAIQKSRAENKPLFVDVYATWCGPCKRMKKFTFTDEKLGAYYNEHFINISLDGETMEGRRFHNSFPFSAYPTLFVISPKGEVLLKEEGFSFAFSLLNKAKNL